MKFIANYFFKFEKVEGVNTRVGKMNINGQYGYQRTFSYSQYDERNVILWKESADVFVQNIQSCVPIFQESAVRKF